MGEAAGAIAPVTSFAISAFGEDPADKAARLRKEEMAQQQALWERQFGPVSDNLRDYMLGVMGVKGAPQETDWQKTYKNTMLAGAESSVRPNEEAARQMLRDKVSANPMGMSNQGFTRGLRDIVREGTAQRGTTYRSIAPGIMTKPFEMAQSFMSRTPYQTPFSTWQPQYPGTTPADMGQGLYEIIKAGQNMYNSYKTPSTPGLQDFSGGMPDFT